MEDDDSVSVGSVVVSRRGGSVHDTDKEHDVSSKMENTTTRRLKEKLPSLSGRVLRYDRATTVQNDALKTCLVAWWKRQCNSSLLEILTGL